LCQRRCCKLERISALLGLLNDYKNLPLAQRDYPIETRLLKRLGNLHQTLGRWVEAEKCYQQDLAICREFGDRVGEGQTLGNLALIQEAQGEIAGALELARQAEAVFEKTEDKTALERARARVAEWAKVAGQVPLPVNRSGNNPRTIITGTEA